MSLFRLVIYIYFGVGLLLMYYIHKYYVNKEAGK